MATLTQPFLAPLATNWNAIETFFARFFLLLGVLTLCPTLLLLLFDYFLYVWRHLIIGPFYSEGAGKKVRRLSIEEGVVVLDERVTMPTGRRRGRWGG
ncbi:hypothetical protein RUND412_001928 [Rhizina undulata]